MATTTRQHTAVIATSSKRFTLKSWQKRTIPVMALDIENIFKTTLEFEDGPEKDAVLEVYKQKRHELDLIIDGIIPFPVDPTFELVEVKGAENDQTERAYFYAPSSNLRIVKQCLETCLHLPAKPHGMVTNEVGILQFGVSECTRQEVMAVYNLHKDLFYGVPYFPEREPKVTRQRGVKSSRVQPLRTVKRSSTNVSLTPQASEVVENEPVTRKATTGELAILKRAIEANQEIEPTIEVDDLTTL